jgi:class 3 adenylate cyclase/predicted ATPase
MQPGPPTAASSAGPALERRLVSVLFADLVGFTTMSENRDPEDVRALLSLYFARCRAIIERHGGMVQKFIGDAVMAVWGTPVAKEDDAERAVRAALALTAAITALAEEVDMPELRVRAGVLTGTAAVDTATVHEGIVHGDTVNTASRLQSIAAPGTVLVDEVTRRTTEAAIAYEDFGTHKVKGREKPVSTWTALRVVAGMGGARREAGLEAHLVGRAQELQEIIDAGECSAREGKSAHITVIGNAGMGKSRLMWEYFKYVDGIEAERWWHQGRCPSYGEGLAYWAFAEMVRARAGIGEDEDPISARAKLRASVEHFVSDERERGLVLPRLAHLLGLEQRSVSEPADLFSGWRLFLERMASTDPVVLVFEDLQWATGGLLDFIDYLLEWSAELPIFILCLARPELESARPDWGETIRLSELAPPQMHELLASLVPGLPAELTERMVERAEGVPLYAVEIVRMLRDRGLLVLEDSRYTLNGELDDLEVPETLQALAAARLDNLERAERSLLQGAAVLGTSFLPEALAAVSGQPEADLRAALDTLVAKQVLGRDDDARLAERGQYHFLQALLRTVALSTLSRRDRKARHLAAAEYMASLPGQTGELAEVQATHLLDAVAMDPDARDADEIRAAAREKLAIAGERTGSLALPDAARSYFEQAAALAQDPIQRAKLLAEAGVAAARAGHPEEARTLLTEAIAGLESRSEAAEAARTRALMADVLIAQRHLDEAAALMDSARESITDETVLAELAARRAHVAMLAGDFPRAHREAETALTIADPVGLPAVVANAELTKAHTLVDQCRLTEAMALCSLALEIGLQADLSEQALRAYNNLSTYRLQSGQPQKAIELIEAGLQLARERGDRPWERDLTAQLISVRAYGGEWDQALAEGDALREHGEDVAERTAWHVRPLILASRGDAEGLTEWLRRELPSSSEWQEQSLDEAVARSTALRAVGRTAEAAALAATALAEIQATGLAGGGDLAIYLAPLVDGLLEDGHAAALTDGLLTIAHPLPAIRGQLSWLGGLLRLREDDPAGAVGALARAVGLMRPVDHPLALARGLLDLGDCLALLGRLGDSAEALREARMVFQGLCATPWLARTERALDAFAAEVHKPVVTPSLPR